MTEPTANALEANPFEGLSAECVHALQESDGWRAALVCTRQDGDWVAFCAKLDSSDAAHREVWMAVPIPADMHQHWVDGAIDTLDLVREAQKSSESEGVGRFRLWSTDCPVYSAQSLVHDLQDAQPERMIAASLRPEAGWILQADEQSFERLRQAARKSEQYHPDNAV